MCRSLGDTEAESLAATDGKDGVDRWFASDDTHRAVAVGVTRGTGTAT